MATTNVRELLIQLAEKESANTVAKVLAFSYPQLNLLDKKKLFEQVQHLIKLKTEFDFSEIKLELEKIESIEDYRDKDFRIESFEMASLRGIPHVNKDQIPYGINFLEDNEINNAIILANNGTGKSSVFAGLEMIYAQEIGERLLRSKASLDKDDFNSYLRRFPDNVEPSCTVKTPAGIFDLNNIVFSSETIRNQLNPSNFFISDYDIYEYGRQNFIGEDNDDNSFHNLIANALGLKKFIDLKSILGVTASYASKRTTETRELKRKKDEKRETGIVVINSEAEIISLRERVKEIESGSKVEKSISKPDRSNDQMASILEKHIVIGVEGEDFIKSRDSFQKSYENVISGDKIKQGVEKDFLDAGLSLLHDMDDCPMCKNSNFSLEEIRAQVEERLNNLNEIAKHEIDLKSEYIALADILNDIYSAFTALFRLVQDERIILGKSDKLIKLYNAEELFYLKFGPVVADEDLFTYITSLSTVFSPTMDDYKRMIDLVRGPIIKESHLLLLELEEFVKFRELELIEYKNTLSEKTLENHDPTVELVLIKDKLIKLEEQKTLSEKRLIDLDPEIELIEKEVEIVNLIRDELKSYVAILDVEINQMVNESFEPVSSMIDEILSDYMDEEGFDFKIHIKNIKTIIDGEELGKEIITAEITYLDKSRKELVTVTPDIYFNTFRYKIFTLMVSLSLALATRKKYNVNIPIVMDDLFSGSDFVSKNSFSDFLLKVIRLFNKHTPNLPLQFILFTHDDVIFRSAIDSISGSFPEEGTMNEMVRLSQTTKIGRFFDPSDTADYPSQSKEHSKYWDLLYELPKDINPLIK